MKFLSMFLLLSCLVVDVAQADAANEVTRLREPATQTPKPSLPVKIATALPERITAGENLTLDVQLSSTLEQGTLLVTFLPDDGLTLVSPQQQLQFTLSTGVFTTSIPLTVVPSEDGRYAVGVEIRYLADGKEQGVTRGITFRVGDAPAVASKSRSTTSADSADNVTSMPAQETIIRQ